jgi:hypothetical protein
MECNTCNILVEVAISKGICGWVCGLMAHLAKANGNLLRGRGVNGLNERKREEGVHVVR